MMSDHANSLVWPQKFYIRFRLQPPVRYIFLRVIIYVLPTFFLYYGGLGIEFWIGFWKVFGPGAFEVGLLVFLGLRLFI